MLQQTANLGRKGQIVNGKKPAKAKKKAKKV